MPAFYRILCPTIANFRQKGQTKVASLQRNIEQVLRLVARGDSVSLKTAYSYSSSIVSSILLSFEIHFAAIAILVFAFSTNMFVPYGATDIVTRIILISVAMLFGSAISLLVVYTILPIHLFFNISLWSLAVLHATATAALFSLYEPTINRALSPGPVPDFLILFLPIFLVNLLASNFMLLHYKDRICLRVYKRLHKAESIKALLPSEKRGEVWLISAADHYVEITTEHGTHTHRMTMKAAVEKAGPHKGIRVHRSHWVAHSAMLTLEKQGERHMLTLRNGLRVPVSPKNAAAVACALDADCVASTQRQS